MTQDYIQNQYDVVVIGGGFSGLISDLCLASNVVKVSILEKSSSLGGLMSSVEKDGYIFDYGIHQIPETGISELDNLVFNILPKDQWIELHGFQKELGGSVFKNELFTSSTYLNLKELDPAEYHELLLDYILYLDSEKSTVELESSSVEECALNQFGKKITQKIIEPCVQSVFQLPLNQLSTFSLLMYPFKRVGLFGEKLTQDTLNANFGNSIAYIDQRNLPQSRYSPLKALYPKKYGLKNYIIKLLEKLKSLGVDLFLNCEIVNFESVKSNITNINCIKENIRFQIWASQYFWSAGLISFANFLNVPINFKDADKPLNTCLVNILTTEPISSDDLHWEHCYEKDFYTYRVVNYYQFWKDAKQNGGYPITIEIILNDDMLEENVESIAVNELMQMKILNKDNQILYMNSHFLKSGFPLPSIKNLEWLNNIRNNIANPFENLYASGVNMDSNLFFLGDILKHSYRQANERLTAFSRQKNKTSVYA